MKKFLLALLLPCAALAGTTPPAHQPEEPAVKNSSLIRVNATNQAFDFFRPWMKKTPYTRRGIGVIVGDNQILITAEMVANRTYIELEKPGSAEKSPAEVIIVDYDANLALLKASDPAFLKGATPLALDTAARVGDRVDILQLESNGVIARTPATITTVTVAPYPMDRLALLTYRMSAPLQNRDGSFTIPAVRDGKLLGLLMRYDSRSQTAELVPSPVIARFLEGAKLAEYVGFPRAGLAFASTRDPQFRRYIKLKEDGGVYLTEVAPDGPAAKAGLKKGDVVLAVGGKAIDQDGNYDDPEFGKISFSHLTSVGSKVGDKLDFTILRDGVKQTIPVTFEARDKSKIVSESYMFDRQPRYYILGGLVFQELSRPYLMEWGGNWAKEAPQRLVYLDAFQDELSDDRGKIVFLSQVLPTQNTVGYENLENLVVSKINGVPIKRLADVARAVASPENGFHKIEFEDDPGFIYLDATEAEKSKAQLMQDYSIPALENLD